MTEEKTHRGRPPKCLLTRVAPNLSHEPSPENQTQCWIWVGPKYLVRGGKPRKQRVYKNGRLDNVYFFTSKDRMQIAPTSYRGKVDTVPRQLYRHFIGEPPPRTRKTCGIGQCCNPWHMTASFNYAELRAELTAPPVLEEIQIESDPHELAEMICEHWQRQPKALLEHLIEAFGSDYSPDEIQKATRIATLEMDGCPPVIRAKLDEILKISAEERRRGR